MTLDPFLTREGIPGIAGVDTRALTRTLREHGVMKGAIRVSERSIDADELVQAARATVQAIERAHDGEISVMPLATSSQPRRGSDRPWTTALR